MDLPGLVALLGSGETSALGGQVFDLLAYPETRPAGRPLRISVLETPAGFELNSPQVAGRIAAFVAQRLQNERPNVEIIPARRKSGPYSPDNPAIVEPLYHADLLFLGPGSPTYAARQLHDSLAWEILRARHRLGAAVIFASAAALAAGERTLPVYEIYKAGQDPFWAGGLKFLAAFGLHPVFIPHWNNTDGGAELDTSHCFIGRQRFDTLRARLRPHNPVVGIDEHTALILDLGAQTARVLGRGAVHVLRDTDERTHPAGTSFPIQELGELEIPGPGADIRVEVMARAREIASASPPPVETPPTHVLELARRREAARQARDWPQADRLRLELQDLGWAIKDTPGGPRIEKLNENRPRDARPDQ